VLTAHGCIFRELVFSQKPFNTSTSDKSGEVVFVYSESYKGDGSKGRGSEDDDDDDDDDDEREYGKYDLEDNEDEDNFAPPMASRLWRSSQNENIQPAMDIQPLGFNPIEDCFARLKELFPDHDDSILR